MSVRSWIVRTGLATRRAAVFQNPGAVALGWAEVPGMGDLTAMEHEAIVTLVQRAGRASDDAERDGAQLVAFRDDVAVGDTVVAPDARSGDVVVGTVVGDYVYDDDARRAGDSYPHRRPVKWIGRVKEADIPEALRDDTRGNLVLRRNDETADAWAALAALAVQEPPAPAARRGRAAARAPRAPAAKKPAAAKKPVAPPAPTQRRCSSCGYSWPLSQFAGDGTLCVECRG